MRFVNFTRMAAGYNVALEVSGRELLVVVVKGTFHLPGPGQDVRLHPEQVPLILADVFSGAPGWSAPVFEADFAPRKQRCDVLLVGSAYAPPGREVTRMTVRMRVGSVAKSFDVVGDRHWQAGLSGFSASHPQPFTRKPISYDVAFGGARADGDVGDAYRLNPVGRGWHGRRNVQGIAGLPLPDTEETGHSVIDPAGSYEPVALGPVGRGWSRRAALAGTYDERWVKETFPFLPADFDERYHQAAPDDQQLPLPDGPIDVELIGLTPDGARRFVLPCFQAPVQVTTRKGEQEDHHGVLDTIVFDPDNNRLMLTWRVTRPLRKSIFEIAEARVGFAGERIREEGVAERKAALA